MIPPALAMAATLSGAGVLAFLEWRRPDRRHLAMRIGAALLAAVALALLGWRPIGRWHAAPAPGRIEAALWTPGAAGEDDGTMATRYRFALPGVAAAPAGATVLPDAAALRRRFPAIGTLHIHGDGLEPFDLDALRGLRVVFHPAPARLAAPAFSFVRSPRELPLGEPLTVQGRVGGLTPGATAALALEAPDGTTTEVTTAPADADGEADFSIGATPPPAAGRFVWRLRVGKIAETLGVAVIPPDLPRVLVLAGTPRFDTAELRRWFERAGGTLAARTLAGQDRYRFESAHDPPPQFTALDAMLLAGFDLMLADGHALAALPPPECAVLRAAVADTGLGVLLLADDDALPGAAGVPPDVAAAFLPWKLAALGGAAEEGEEERLTRVEWPGQAHTSEIPLPAAPFEIVPQAGQMPLARDGQGHALAVSAALGRGRIALTLVRETGRWTRENDPGAFAAYWSWLFSRLARPAVATANAGRWALVGGDAGPVFVDQPAELAWQRQPGAGAEPLSGVIAAAADEGSNGVGASLPLARDPGASGLWRGTFWPRRAGWHRVTMPPSAGANGGAMDFFVAPAGDWAALDTARRRAATGRFAEDSVAASGPARAAWTGSEADVPKTADGWWYVLFLAGAGYLWAERRRAGAAPSPTP